jgi:hypothetical protein
VSFIPSGLVIFLKVKEYSSVCPLIFSIKLYEINRDSDGDGILNFQEDLNNDGYIYNYSSKVNYPTFPADIRYER